MKKKELEKIVQFLCKYNKDEIGADQYCFGFLEKELRFKYLYNGKLMQTDGVYGFAWKVIENNENNAIIEVADSMIFSENRYLFIDKESAKITNITKDYKLKTKEQK